MEEKRIYFLDHLPIEIPEDWPDTPIIHTWQETENAIYNNEPLIFTTQMGLMSMRLVEHGYRVFVFDENAHHIFEAYEIKEGSCERTDREIRLVHNIFRMWDAGAFAKEQ